MNCSLVFKGSQGEEAVLCSRSKTFAIKSVETSNLVLLVDPAAGRPVTDTTTEIDGEQKTDMAIEKDSRNDLSGANHLRKVDMDTVPGLRTQREISEDAAKNAPVVVSAVANAHLELIQVRPRLHALDKALKRCPYGLGEDNADCIAKKDHAACSGMNEDGYTWDELLEIVQASPDELGNALEKCGAICIDGRWRSIDPTFLGTLLEIILLTIVEKGWSTDRIPCAELSTSLEETGYKPEVILHCLKLFGCSNNEKDIDNSDRVMDVENMAIDGQFSGRNFNTNWLDSTLCFSLNDNLVCRYFGIKLLDQRSKWSNLEEFLSCWEDSSPDGMKPSLEMLAGEAVRDDPKEGSGIWRLSESSLPQDAPGRFKALFEAKKHWELSELLPYIQSLAGPGETTETLLLKYARANQQKPTDPVTYSAR